MNENEVLNVYIDWRDGKTHCICLREKKRCKKSCSKDVVERDKYRDWEKTFKQDQFGKSHFTE